MKRITALLMALLIAGTCALAEGASAREAEIAAGILGYFCETTGFPGAEAEELSVHVEYQDSPLANPALSEKRWVVAVCYARCDGLLSAFMNYILSEDGTSILQESSIEDFNARLKAIRRVEPVLLAQRSIEAESGPFRDWTEQAQQAFIAQYGDVSSELSLLQCPRQTDLQYWEIGELAREALREEGLPEEDIAALQARYSYMFSDMDWLPTSWNVSFFLPASDPLDAGSEHIAVDIELNGLEVSACTVIPGGGDFFSDRPAGS